MASSSSSIAMASSGDKACSYDVFLSFRGDDTRDTFTDHLYDKLDKAGIHTFRDNEEISKGEELKPELKRAIKESRASIVVLSTNYATSTWCLDELLLILEQRRECNHFVLPVFYGVEPTDVRNQKGSYAIQVKPSSKWTDHNVSLWKAALMEVANLSGEVVLGPETSILKKIVDTLYDKLDRKEVPLPPNITGMSRHDQVINCWLQQDNLQFLSIYGMGGSGKTTLAKYIYNSNQNSFEYVSFVEHIGSRCEKPNGLLEVQEQLLKDILGGKGRKIPGVFRGTPMIAEALQKKRTLIVLDDIVGHSQLIDLLGTGEINAQSKIILTTRENTDNWLDFSYWRCQKYKMRLLNNNESSELLCRHAFRFENPKEGFQEVVLRAVQYCEGNPLALEVLGSSLFKSYSIHYWESQLRLLEREIDARVFHVLERSYMSLPSETVKELFLHIACFFNGIDMDYVVKILEPDYSAECGIKILINKCLLSVSPNKKLTMHRLLQEMGKNIVRQESHIPAKRSRVWHSSDSYKILRKRKGSETVEGLALDMKMLSEEDIALKPSKLETDALKNMDSLKLLQLNFVELDGSYENFSEDLRWLCWIGFHLKTIPSDLYMGHLVAIDMSYSKLEVFEPPMVLHSLRILNFKDSHKLTEISNISNIPKLETLILWNCYSLANVCKTIGGLGSLALLNMMGCKNLFNREQIDLLSAYASVTEHHIFFPFPTSLHRLFLKDCHLDCTESFTLSFSCQPDLQYMNLGNSLFEELPCYNHLENLRVLDLSFCSRLKCLCLPNTLEELYIYGCELLERITFQSPRFTLQEFGYLGCIHLYEVEGFMKLVPIAKLDENELGHMKWLKEYQKHEVCLVGDDELTTGRSWQIQMLYEFGIRSTSLPDIKDPNMTPEYISESSSLIFDIPSCPKNKRLKGLNVAFKYSISGDDWAWFCKVSTSNSDLDLMYNPKVFGKPEFGESCIWLSYWPIGNTLDTGDTLNVSIVVMSGLEVHECGVSLVYCDQETIENNMGWAEVLGGDLSGFKLSTGSYYLCRRDFFELTRVKRLTHYWFRILVGDTIDYTEVRGWRKTGRPKHVNPSLTELKIVQCIIHGPQLEDIYKIAEISKSSVDKTMAFTSSLHEGEIIDETMEEIYDKQYESRNETVGITMEKSDLYSHGRIMNSATGEGEKSSSSTSAQPCRPYSLEEIKSATNNFDVDRFIAHGHYGSVYKGQITSEEAVHVVAIKRFDSRFNLEELEFRAEIDMLSTLCHRHLVSLIGYCHETKQMILVYEYIRNGSLHHHLHEADTPLSWLTRLKIAIGAARGLDYLHTSVGMLHCDVKSSNILLDENWAAMISGFWFKIGLISFPYRGAHVIGSFGYSDPEYFLTGSFTRKSDVYAFGVVLFELLCGRRIGEDDFDVVSWAQKCMNERKLDQMVDPNMKGTISTKCLRGFTQIADRCVHGVSKKRPTMSEIVASLEALLELQEKCNLSGELQEESNLSGELQEESNLSGDIQEESNLSPELQEKSNRSAKRSVIPGFAWKLIKYFVPATKPTSGLREKHKQELESLTLTSQPFQTSKLFIVAIAQYLQRSLVYLFTHGVWLMLLVVFTVAGVVLFLSANGPRGTHVEELLEYVRFALWWVALGMASSIGLGSGLHTFVLYLGPHIAFFTIKAMQCGRVDIKSAIYDTIQSNRIPSWLKKDCSEYGPPLFSTPHGIQVPLTSILPQVQVEAILWGLGTALGELPPYLISRAASISGEKIDATEELDASSAENNGVASNLNHMKRWFLSHAQYLNFFTILVLASVPNPLFDLAGIMCGQFGVPFWKFFLATLIGKAIVKTHIQTVFIISVCNNQLLYWIENELIWMLSFIPGVASALPNIVAKLHAMKEKYMAAPLPVTSNIKVKSWDLSFASVWNSVVWLMLLNFFVKIVNSTAQRFLKKQQETEMSALKKNLEQSEDCSSH